MGHLDRTHGAALMHAMDASNARWDCGTMVPARPGLLENREWSAKFEMHSPAYTTRLGDLPVVHASA